MSENHCVVFLQKNLACCVYIVFPMGFHISRPFFVMDDVLRVGKFVLEKMYYVFKTKKKLNLFLRHTYS